MSGKKATRPTMKDVAVASGHSLSTVDRVLNGRSTVRSDTAKEIHQAAETIGYFAAGVIRQRVSEVRPRRKLGFLLQQPETLFYIGLSAELQRATEACPSINGKSLIEYLKGQSPELVADHILNMGKQVDALAIVATDHPLVTEAIHQLASKGVPVFALISDLSAPSRAGYVGMDNRRLGRTAAWFISRQSRPGKFVMFVGSPRFQCQELNESSFLFYMREHAPKFQPLETIITMENESYAEERTYDLLKQHPDLCGFYVGGNGIEGVLRALKSQKPKNPIVGVCGELTAITRSALLTGHVAAVLSHPMTELCRQLVFQMAEELNQPSGALRQAVVQMEIHVPTSVS